MLSNLLCMQHMQLHANAKTVFRMVSLSTELQLHAFRFHEHGTGQDVSACSVQQLTLSDSAWNCSRLFTNRVVESGQIWQEVALSRLMSEAGSYELVRSGLNRSLCSFP